MKALLIYWIFGCIVIGSSTGLYLSKCPHDDVPALEMVEAISVWPALLIGAITLTKTVHTECKRMP